MNINPGNNYELQKYLQLHLLNTGMWHSCLNCEHWKDNTYNAGVYKGCEIADFSVPPVEVIVHGCPSWLLEIPF